MRILIDIGHPAHVHFFRNFIKIMEKRGHKFLVTARDKDVSLELLKLYSVPHHAVGKNRKSVSGKLLGLVSLDYSIIRMARKFKPDLFLGVHNPYTAQSAWLLRKKSITFTDSEPVPLGDMLTFPFTSLIVTPTSYRKKLGKKHVRYNGFKELAYLHPKYFKPDDSVLKQLRVNGEPFFILRFVSWNANHDVGRQGLDTYAKRALISVLKKHGKVFISSEKPLEPEFEEYRFSLPADRMHHALYYAKMLIGDSQTMTTEAAILGTPAIRCNSFVGPNDMGNFIELEKKYDLIYSFSSFGKALAKVKLLLRRKNLKADWVKKREKLLKDKIDVTEWMVEFLEHGRK